MSKLETLTMLKSLNVEMRKIEEKIDQLVMSVKQL
jgi:hypothetical protein